MRESLTNSMRSAVRRRVRLQLRIKNQRIRQHETSKEHQTMKHDLLVRILGRVKAEAEPKEGCI
jgi:hypothetical protein